jgi:Zn-dependent protease/predicted transcriptional regulator
MVMRSGFRIGRIFGIDIRVDWSWLLIFALVTWNLSNLFSQSHAGWSPTLIWGLSVLAALLFFASVLGHELAHSLVAKGQGVPVRNITLFMFGGVSNIQRDPDSAGREFWMALVGPLTSLVLGGVLLLIGGSAIGPLSGVTDPTKVVAQLNPLTALVLWLGSINLTLGIFNLIPGFPLDGGRVLRSILWAASGDLHRATRWAAGVGQLIAWAMILTGIGMVFGLRVPFFGSGFVGGVWLAFIGWFLNTASSQSYRQLVVHDILDQTTVERVMRVDPPTVPSGISIGTLVHDHVMGKDDYGFPVLDGGRLVGIVTLEDVRKVGRDNWDTAVVREIMTPADQLVTVSPGDDAAEALDKLTQNDVRQLPVIRGGELIGLLRRRDIIKWLQLHSEMSGGRARSV